MSEPRSAAELIPQVMANFQATMTATRPDPLAHPKAVRIALDCDTSDVLRELGETFVVIARQSYPGDRNRMQLLCLPVPLAVARAAESVALGTHRAVKNKSLTMSDSNPPKP
jgi:hypothetical protein